MQCNPGTSQCQRCQRYFCSRECASTAQHLHHECAVLCKLDAMRAAAVHEITPEVAYAKTYAEAITDRLGLDDSSLVIEVASNDGYLLRNFVEAGIPCLGIEPTDSTADVAETLGIPVLREFFGESLGRQLASNGLQRSVTIRSLIYSFSRYYIKLFFFIFDKASQFKTSVIMSPCCILAASGIPKVSNTLYNTIANNAICELRMA